MSVYFVTKIDCPCGCGERVEVRDEGFHATRVTITACAKRHTEKGWVSYETTKSALQQVLDRQQLARDFGCTVPELVKGLGELEAGMKAAADEAWARIKTEREAGR